MSLNTERRPPTTPTDEPPGMPAARWLGRTWAQLSYGRRVEPTWLEVNEHHLLIDDLAPAFSGVRIAHLTDFHGGEHLPPTYLDDVVERTMSLNADAIALTGDFVHKGYRHVDDVARSLGKLAAPLGVFAVLGNHDFSVRNALGWRRHRGLHQSITDALAGQGIQVLRNRAVIAERDGAALDIVGVDDLWSGECLPTKAFRDLPSHSPRIVLAHNPLTVDLLGAERCDLMLSGHTHGGQVNWPGLGRLFIGRKRGACPRGFAGTSNRRCT